jgi:hypothetical protein
MIRYAASLFALGSISMFGANAGAMSTEWLLDKSVNPLTDRASTTVALTGDYIPSRLERPTVGFACAGGHVMGRAVLTTGGLIVGPKAALLVPHFEKYGLGVATVQRLDQAAHWSHGERPIRGSLGLFLSLPLRPHLPKLDLESFDGQIFGQAFIGAARYLIQFDIFPNGSLTAEFHPSEADNTEVKQQCGFK